jgi:hypothetical protein
MIAIAPTSSMTAMVTSITLIEGGACVPRIASTATAKAMSVAVGIAHPCAQRGSNPVTDR